MSVIEDAVCKKILSRAEFGLSKYGVTMERKDISTIGWMIHLQEELMDALVYLERLKQDLETSTIDHTENL